MENATNAMTFKMDAISVKIPIVVIVATIMPDINLIRL